MIVAIDSSRSDLDGLSVLLVEDNFLNGIALQQSLEDMGCQVVGPVASVQKGLEIVRDACIDLAVLDINIIGGVSVPIAEKLIELDRLFLFVTGYASPFNLPDSLATIPRLNKPVGGRKLQDALMKLIDAQSE